jgi:hypothetical protein
MMRLRLTGAGRCAAHGDDCPAAAAATADVPEALEVELPRRAAKISLQAATAQQKKST